MGNTVCKESKNQDGRIVILGKTGAGKSSLANTIFGEKIFTTNHSPNSGTSKCQAKTKSVNGRNITLIDTPGFFDTKESEKEMKPEILRCITECAPGPHAFLILLKVEKFTEQEQAVIAKICEYFTEEVFKYSTVVFTHGSQLQKGQTIEDYVSQNEHLSDLVKKCGGRCHVIDNEYWNNNPTCEYRSNKFQVEELLKAIDKIDNGSYYTNDLLQEVNKQIDQEKERIRESSGNMSEQEITEEARARVHTKLSVRLAGVVTGALLGALFGAGAIVVILLILVKGADTAKKAVDEGGAAKGGAFLTTTGGVAATAIAVTGEAVAAGTSFGVVIGVPAAVGAVMGGMKGYEAAEGADTPMEAAKKAVEGVKEGAKSLLDETSNILNIRIQQKSKQS